MPSRDSEPQTDLYNPKLAKRNGRIVHSISESLKKNGMLSPDPETPELSFGTAAGDVLRNLRRDGFTVHDAEGEVSADR